MKQQFNTIGVIGRLGSAQVVDTLKRLIRFLDSRGLAMVIEERTATLLLDHGLQVASRRQMGEQCDLVIVVGGDGSLLGAARALCRSGTPCSASIVGDSVF